MRVPLYILTGGRSSRFGSDKARAVLGGAPLAVRIAQALESSVSEIILVSRSDETHADLGFRCIGDDAMERGPLGGLVAALQDRLERSGPGWLLLSPCDILNPDPAWVGMLVGAAGENECETVVFQGERLEPLFALYHTSILPRAREHLGAGVLAMHALVRSAPHRLVPLPEPPPYQANTREDLARFASRDR